MLAHRILYDKFFATPFKNAYMAGDFPSILVCNYCKPLAQSPLAADAHVRFVRLIPFSLSWAVVALTARARSYAW